MNILFVAPQPFYQVRGTCLATERVLTVLGDSGHSIDLLTYPGGRDLPLDNVRIERIPAPPWIGPVPIGPSWPKVWLDAILLPAMARRLATRRYDLIHAVEEAAVLASWLSPVFRVPYIYDMDSILSDQVRYSGFLRSEAVISLVRAMERRAIARAAAVAVIAPSHARYCSRFTSPGKVFLIEDVPATIRCERENAGKIGETSRERFALGDAPVLLYTGNLASYQGIELMLEAFRLVHLKRPQVHLVIIGGNDDRVHALREFGEDQAWARNVHFTGGQPLDSVVREMRDADVLLSPRTFGDNPPLKIYDYMLSGRPIVATDLPMHTQVLCENMAFLARAEALPFSRAILRAITDEEGAAGRAANAKRLVETHHTPALFARKLRRLYRSVEESGKAGLRGIDREPERNDWQLFRPILRERALSSRARRERLRPHEESSSGPNRRPRSSPPRR